MKKLEKLLGLTTLTAMVAVFFGGVDQRIVSANSTPQTLPFSQDWSNGGLITTNDDWSAVPGIQGFLGQDLTTATAADPRNILTPASALANDLDVIANQSNPNTQTTGGVAEFEATFQTIALQGSGTADAPHIILYLNTTGQNNIRVSYNLRDIDGSADNAVTPVALQYRVGSSGNFINVPGGFVADATLGPGDTTLTTPVAVTLPAAASNQAQVQVRIITTNSIGSDEWIGIDDISVTAVATPARSTAPVDFNGDGRTDFAVARNVSGQYRWFYNTNPDGPTIGIDWGLVGDTLLADDFDGDGKDDITVWRPALGVDSSFYILQSQTGTVRVEKFGLLNDDATVVGDYDGDGKADPAVYRPGAAAGLPSTWFYRGSMNNPSGNVTYIPWGVNGDKVAPGDYDGDGKYDFVVARADGANYRYWKRLATGDISTELFGLVGDSLVPGDYDGDAKTDLAVTRAPAGPIQWYIQPSSAPTGPYQTFLFGQSGEQTAQGDYDGDGRTDIAIWRFSTGTFWWRNSSNSGIQTFALGGSNDTAIAFYNRH